MNVIWAAIQPVLIVLIMVLLGVYLKYAGIYNQAVMKQLGRLAVSILSPSLLMTKIATSISLSNIDTYLIVFSVGIVYQIYYFIMGGLIYAVSKRYTTPSFNKSILSSSAFGNWSDFPIAILLAIGNSPPFQPEDADKGIAFNTAFVLVLVPFVFTIGEYWIIQDFKSISSDTNSLDDGISEDNKPLYLVILNHRVVRMVAFNPNILGILIGLLLALTPLYHVFVIPSAPMFFLFRTIQTIGNAYVAISLSLFGANLMYADFSFLRQCRRHSPPSTFPKTLYIPIGLICGMRMILSPIVGISIVQFMVSMSWVVDPIVQFVLILPSLMPVAQMNLILSQIQHPDGKPLEMATLVAICYLCTPISLIASLTTTIYFINN